jgi:hypothetical protein
VEIPQVCTIQLVQKARLRLITYAFGHSAICGWMRTVSPNRVAMLSSASEAPAPIYAPRQ